MGILTDRLNSIKRRMTWRMSHEAAIINIKEVWELLKPLKYDISAASVKP
jgi:hypothetical protein